MKRRTILRTGVILLAATLVIAVTWAKFTPYDLAADLAAREAVVKGQTSAPGAEAVLRRLMAAPPPHRDTDVTKLGPPQSIGYLGSETVSPNAGAGEAHRQFPRATYRDGTLVWRVGLDKKGAPDVVTYFNVPPTPAQTIIAFSSISASRLWFWQRVGLPSCSSSRRPATLSCASGFRTASSCRHEGQRHQRARLAVGAMEQKQRARAVSKIKPLHLPIKLCARQQHQRREQPAGMGGVARGQHQREGEPVGSVRSRLWRANRTGGRWISPRSVRHRPCPAGHRWCRSRGSRTAARRKA